MLFEQFDHRVFSSLFGFFMRFKCINCDKEKQESELGSINWFLRIAYACIFAPLSSRSVCKNCIVQISVAGFIGAIFLVMALVGALISLAS